MSASSVSGTRAERGDKMKNLFYQLASSRSLAKIFSMDAQIEERKRVIFPKRLFFAVLGLAAFVSLGALLFPQIVRADCWFDCTDVGSDPSLNTWGQSPQSQLDIAYVFDRDGLLALKDSKGKPIFTGNSIPTPHVSQTSTNLSCPGSGGIIEISGTVVALLRDKKGNLIPNSAAQASLLIRVLDVTCDISLGTSIASRVVHLLPSGVSEPRTNVFDQASSITILPPTTPGTPASLTSKGQGWTGCPTDNTGTLSGSCLFPLGIEEFTASQLSNQLPATTTGPTVNRYQIGEVFREVQSTKFAGVRDCKGDPQDVSVQPAPDPSTINCGNGEILTGGTAQALFTFDGNWSGSVDKTINPKSSTGPFDIFSTVDFLSAILPDTVTASADNGPEVKATSCNDNFNQNPPAERCNFPAKKLLPNGCTDGVTVNILVRGKLAIQDGNGNDFGFVSRDDPICNNNG